MFGNKLKEIRTNSNVKQIELANYLGVRNTTISAWETGDNEPDLTTVVKIANFFHVTTDYLLDNVNDLSQIIGNNLRVARINAGYTQKEIAEKLHTKQTIYSRYETGKLQLDYEKITLLCKIYQIDSTKLFNI